MLILLLAIALRFSLIESRTLHFDEAAIWSTYLKKILLGQPLAFNPDFYGFSSYYIIAVPMMVFGDDLFGIRFANTLASCLILCLWCLLAGQHRWNYGYLIGLGIAACSPSLVYYSTHVSQHIFIISLMFVSAWLLTEYIRTKRIIELLALSVCLGLMLSGHLLNFVFIGIVSTILIGQLMIERYSGTSSKKLLDPFDFNYTHISIGIMVTIAVVVTVMTSGLKDFSNLTAFLSQFSHQLDKSRGTGHDKHFLYYVITFIKLEPFAFAGTILSFWWLEKNRFNWALIIFTWLTIFLLSLMPYKIPWLFIIALYPMYFLSALTMANILSGFKDKNSSLIALSSAALIIFIWTSFQSYVLNVPNKAATAKVNPLNYVGPVADTERLYSDLASRINKHGQQKALIIMRGYWPLPYYMQDYTKFYLPDPDGDLNLEPYINDYDLFITKAKNIDSTTELSSLHHLGPTYELRQGLFVNVLVKN